MEITANIVMQKELALCHAAKYMQACMLLTVSRKEASTDYHYAVTRLFPRFMTKGLFAVVAAAIGNVCNSDTALALVW